MGALAESSIARSLRLFRSHRHTPADARTPDPRCITSGGGRYSRVILLGKGTRRDRRSLGYVGVYDGFRRFSLRPSKYVGFASRSWSNYGFAFFV